MFLLTRAQKLWNNLICLSSGDANDFFSKRHLIQTLLLYLTAIYSTFQSFQYSINSKLSILFLLQYLTYSVPQMCFAHVTIPLVFLKKLNKSLTPSTQYCISQFYFDVEIHQETSSTPTCVCRGKRWCGVVLHGSSAVSCSCDSRIQLFSTAVSSSLQHLDCSPPGSSVHGIFHSEYWSGLPFPSPGDLPDPGMEPAYLVSLALTGGFFTTEPSENPYCGGMGAT